MFLADSDWSWVTNQGLAVGILIALGYAFYRGISWTGTTIVSPIKDAVINHLQTVSVTLTDVSSTMRSIDAKVDHVDAKTSRIIDTHEGFYAEALKDRESVHQRLDKLEQKQL